MLGGEDGKGLKLTAVYENQLPCLLTSIMQKAASTNVTSIIFATF